MAKGQTNCLILRISKSIFSSASPRYLVSISSISGCPLPLALLTGLLLPPVAGLLPLPTAVELDASTASAVLLLMQGRKLVGEGRLHHVVVVLVACVPGCRHVSLEVENNSIVV